MGQKNSHRLFREKLAQIEVSPSINAWSKIEKQIRPKKKPVMYWVAASVSLVVISWVIGSKTTPHESSTPIVYEVSHPVQRETPTFVVPMMERKEKKTTPVTGKRGFSFASTTGVKPSQKEEQEPLVHALEKPLMMVAKTELERPETVDTAFLMDEKPLPASGTVKITYIASNPAPMVEKIGKSDSTRIFKKMIAFVGKIDPIDVLASIKTAKENLLNGRLKGEKNKNAL